MNPNQGFWRSLCAFEEQLGITDRQVSVLYAFPALTQPQQRRMCPVTTWCFVGLLLAFCMVLCIGYRGHEHIAMRTQQTKRQHLS